MGKQVRLFDEDNTLLPERSPRPEAREASFVARAPLSPFAKETPEPRDEMSVIGRGGQVKTVRFLQVSEASALVSWPISNDVIEVSLKTGDLKIKRGEKLWRLEPAALAACRRLRSQSRKKLSLLPDRG